MLDIIIPTYKNKDGLRKTLQSINTKLLNDIIINVIDDCSQLDYSDIQNQFPYVQFYINKYNGGPGIARNNMILWSHEPYILFIDTGDFFLNYEVQEEIIETIKQNPEVDIFSWAHIAQSTGKICKDTHNRLHGRVYKREFLEKYHIHFSVAGARANEDIGFNRICRIIIENLNEPQRYLHLSTPVIMWEYNENSITKENNCAFNYAKQNMGLALNEIHVFDTCIRNNVSSLLLQKEAGEIMASMHHGIYQTAQERPEYLQQAWDGAYMFYHTIYKNYENVSGLYLQATFSKTAREVHEKKEKWNKPISLNIKRFLSDIKQYEQIPAWYLPASSTDKTFSS